MDIYDETTDAFTPLSAGDTKTFPELYPGMYLLPNHTIFYSRTGWASAGPGSGPFSGASDDQSAYFTLTGADTGVWNDIAPVSPAQPDRTKGMSVLLLSKSPPYVRILVLGGSDPSTNHTYELIDVTSLSPATDWDPPVAFPDGQHRSLASAVLLPDGNVFVCGGILSTNSPCTLFRPETDTWSPMAVTHQTDTEQKVIELDWAHDHEHAHPKKLRLKAPHGGHPHSLAQRGYYMMFAISDQGVPSEAWWIFLH